MRRLLVDQARSRRRQKRGGEKKKKSLSPEMAVDANTVDVIDLHDALDEDVVVGADGDLTQVPGARVLIEHGDQEILVLRRLGIDHLTLLEGHLDVVHFAPVVHRGKGIANHAVGPAVR